jgi:hypothetical protein
MGTIGEGWTVRKEFLCGQVMVTGVEDVARRWRPTVDSGGKGCERGTMLQCCNVSWDALLK